MTKLPNPQDAVVDVRKLRDYCLSPQHPRGRHKARVFASALGLTYEDVEDLREALLSAAHSQEAVFTDKDQYGERYVLDFEMEADAGTVVVRSGWIVRREEGFPRLTTCWVP